MAYVWYLFHETNGVSSTTPALNRFYILLEVSSDLGEEWIFHCIIFLGTKNYEISFNQETPLNCFLEALMYKTCLHILCKDTLLKYSAKINDTALWRKQQVPYRIDSACDF